MKTTIVISTLAYAVLLSAVSITALTSLAPTAHAQTQGGCSGNFNPQHHTCENPHNIPGGPVVPSTHSSQCVLNGGSHFCRG